MRRKVAAVFALLVLTIGGIGVMLTALGEDVYRGADRRILMASENLADPPPI